MRRHPSRLARLHGGGLGEKVFQGCSEVCVVLADGGLLQNHATMLTYPSSMAQQGFVVSRTGI